MNYLIKIFDIDMYFQVVGLDIPYIDNIKHVRNFYIDIEPAKKIHNRMPILRLISGNQFEYNLGLDTGIDLRVFLPERTILSEESFCDLLYHFITLVLINNEIMILHAASVSDNNNNILIIGESGAGKSEIIFNLIKCYNYSLITDDRTCIKNLEGSYCIINTDRFIKIRSSHTIAKKTIIPTPLSQANLTERHAINFLIIPCISCRQVTATRVGKEELIELISKQVLSTIRGTDYCIFDNSGDFISFAPVAYMRSWDRFFSQICVLCSNIPALIISGSVDFICEQINRISSER